MANMTVAEDRTACLPAGTEVHLWALAQKYFEDRKYTLIKQEEEYALYACLHGDASVASVPYYICDLLIVSQLATLTEAEAAVPRLDGMTEQIRHALLQGKPIHKELRVQKHGFLKLRRPYICYSYTYREKPVGFQIRPLILLSEGTSVWEYFMGPTTRVDAVFFPGATLNGYLKDHRDTLKASREHLVNLHKFRYPKMAQRLIGYGPLPIIAFWVVSLFWAIAKHSLPLSLEGLVGLSIVLYGACIGASYLLHGLFVRAQRAELREPTPFQPTRASPAYNASEGAPSLASEMEQQIRKVEQQVTEIEAESEAESAQVSPPIEAPSLPKTGFSRTQVQTLIRKILTITELDELTTSMTHLLTQVFQLVMETNHQECPPHSTLPDLLKMTRTDPIVGNYYRDFKFWISKLETWTPFDPRELKEVKKFLLRLLYQLQLLPEDLQEMVQSKTPRKLPAQGSPQSASPPAQRLPPAKIRLEPPQVPPAPKAPSAFPLEGPPGIEDPPDIEVDSQVFTEIPQVNSYQVRKIRERPANGVYCTLYIDKQTAQFADLVQQFEASTRDFDIIRNYVDISIPEESLPQQELSGASYPVVVVGCGEHRQVLAYGQRQDDAHRLHSVITSFLQPLQVGPDSESNLEEAEEDLQQTKDLISLKERVTKNGDPSKIEALEQPRVVSKELPKGPPKEILKRNPKISLKVESAEAPKVGPIRLPTVEPQGPPQDLEVAPQAEAIELPREVPRDPSKPPRPQLTIVSKPGTPGPATTPVIPTAPMPSTYKRINPLMIKKLNQYLILIDGTNLAFLLSDALKDDSGPRLDCIFQVIEMLTRLGFARENMLGFFDSTIKKKFEKAKREIDYTRLTTYMQQDTHPKFRIVTSGAQADTALLSLGENTDGTFIILTNDGMQDQPDWAFHHRVPVTLDQNNAPQLIIESMTALMDRFYGKGNERHEKEGGR